MAPDLEALLGIRDGDVVAVAGAGGKHTLLARLAGELAAAGREIVLTTTTNLHRSAVASLPVVRIEDPSWEEAVAAALAAGRRVVVVRRAKGPGMEEGLPPDAVRHVRDAAPGATVVVKADGARKRLLKAPGPDEPSWPEDVTVAVLVLALAAVGRPLDEATAHRVERVRALAPRDPITADTLVSVALHGYAPRMPQGARTVLFLSHATDSRALETARAIAARVRPGFETVVAADTIEGRFHLLP